MDAECKSVMDLDKAEGNEMSTADKSRTSNDAAEAEAKLEKSEHD